MTRSHVSSIALGLLVLGATTATLAGQAPPAERLRQELDARFAQQVQVQLGLTDDQAARVREVLRTYARQRLALERSERELRQALHFQLRPGIAADPDSVGTLVDRIADVRVQYTRLMQDEMKELTTILTPVQRGQFFLLRDRILQRVEDIRGQRGRFAPPPL